MKIIPISIVLLCAVLITGCNGEDRFLITGEHIGPLSQTTTVNELEALFTNDSIVISKGGGEYADEAGSVTLYEKGGKKLLYLSPKDPSSTSSTIEVIR